LWKFPAAECSTGLGQLAPCIVRFIVKPLFQKLG